ncbi:MAG: KpsF/GutQ family sugar-phosphate isomerase [Holosporaceae bacterium]|jgi:arabinose-5-phosphate isomerase|nr:KpsF/GutQ family sugar-phosphate isomerase [Holosporaceae bacterium]
MSKELKYVKSILREEIAGLEMLHDSIDASIVSAIDLFYSKRSGHVIVSGMGKPGHVGRKVSATLASTGTPSFFLHPGEASHGDLGEISPDDVLMVLSLSGDTEELVPMLSYANRFNVAVVALTSNPDSILAQSARVNILIPKIREACPYNLAPTTTTTMMMAIGDAIALCLLKRKEFKRDDFKKLHPGGTLGKRLLMVQDLMHTNTPVVQENDFMKSVLIEMTKKNFGCTCVVNAKNQIVGVITDGDLRRSISPNFLDMKASDVMGRNPKVVPKEMFAQEATKMMNSYKIMSLFVIEGNKIPCGILYIHDCLKAGLA